MKKIGLFFGSFNPIHIGHIILANHIAENTDINEVWFVVTPLNPFKEKKNLLDNYSRLEMVEIALKKYDKLNASDIEFHLPQPNYTINTLIHLEEKHKNIQFYLIMGEDNLKSFHKWKNYEVLLERYPILVYPRISEGEVPDEFKQHLQIHYTKAPIIEISATFIREQLKAGKNVSPLLDPDVWKHIDQKGFYL